MAAQTDSGIHAWSCMEKRDFESASSLTWFGVADPFTDRWQCGTGYVSTCCSWNSRFFVYRSVV